jgi:methionyl-tRNA formyltransferase
MTEPIKIRTIFMGTSDFARVILDMLIQEKYNIVAVYSQPDKEAGRGQQIKTGPVKELALTSKIPLFQPNKFDAASVSEVIKLKPDLIIVAAYGKILPKEILEAPGFGCINIHASLLPKFRGPSPIQNAILYGEKETGITIMLMNQGIDTGYILSQEKIAIEPQDTADDLSQKLSELGAKLLINTIPSWVEQKIKPQKQDDSNTSLCQLIEREDGHVIWEEEAEKIYNKFRAFYPWPGIFGFWKNKDTTERIKFKKISVQNSDPQTTHQSGEIFQLSDKIGVQTLKGVIILEEIQLEGKSPVAITDFINGYPNFIGSILC